MLWVCVNDEVLIRRHVIHANCAKFHWDARLWEILIEEPAQFEFIWGTHFNVSIQRSRVTRLSPIMSAQFDTFAKVRETVKPTVFTFDGKSREDARQVRIVAAI